jgi:hypothetical protein
VRLGDDIFHLLLKSSAIVDTAQQSPSKRVETASDNIGNQRG